MNGERAPWRVSVDDGCIGAGSCVGVAPSHFELGTDGRSRPRVHRLAPDETVLDAAASCPMQAITIVDTGTGEIVET